MAEIAHNKFVSVEERAKSAGDVCEQISSFLIESVHYIVDTGVNICQQWLKNVVEPADEQGKGKLGYDTGVIRRTLLGAVESGELRAETPTESLAESVATFYYGAVTVWAITDGKADPVKLMENYSTGAEMNNGAVITNAEKKMKSPLWGAFYRFAILDPAYTMTMPLRQVLSGAFDSLSHSMETYMGSPREINYSDEINESTQRCIIRHIRATLKNPQDPHCRSELLWAAAMAENGMLKLGKVTDFRCHMLEHQLGAYTEWWRP